MLLNCSGEKNDNTHNTQFDNDKYVEMLNHYKYSKILKELYPKWRNELSDTVLSDPYLVIAASRKARFYLEAYNFDLILGIDAYKTIETFKKVRINKYHHFFSSIYYYLWGDKKNALIIINIFLKQNVSSDWKNDANILKRIYSGKTYRIGDIKNSIVKVIIESFPETKIDFNSKFNEYNQDENKLLWKAGPILQKASIDNVLKISELVFSVELKNNAIFQEKISEIKVDKDSIFILYNKYYNPLLLKNLAYFYKTLAKRFYKKLPGEYYPENRIIMQSRYEYVKMLLDFDEILEADDILNQLLKYEQNKILQTAYKIDLYYCKIAKSGDVPDFNKMLRGLKAPVLQSYFIYRMAKLDHFFKQNQFGFYFKLNEMNRSTRLTCSEYIGNYYMLKKDYKRAQNNYQRRLLGGSYDISRNEHIYLLRFMESFYHNKLNRNLGNWGLRNLLNEYPELIQIEYNYTLIDAGDIFK
jgi:hypothetical protein